LDESDQMFDLMMSIPQIPAQSTTAQTPPQIPAQSTTVQTPASQTSTG